MAGPATEKRAPTCPTAGGNNVAVGDWSTTASTAPHDVDRDAADDVETDADCDTDADEGDGDATP